MIFWVRRGGKSGKKKATGGQGLKALVETLGDSSQTHLQCKSLLSTLSSIFADEFQGYSVCSMFLKRQQNFPVFFVSIETSFAGNRLLPVVSVYATLDCGSILSLPSSFSFLFFHSRNIGKAS